MMAGMQMPGFPYMGQQGTQRSNSTSDKKKDDEKK